MPSAFEIVSGMVEVEARRLGVDSRNDECIGRIAAFSQCCSYYACMVAITVRDVPDEVRDELAARAARAGKSLQEYLRGLLVGSVSKPTTDDLIARARARVDATAVRLDAAAILAMKDVDRR